MNYSQRRPLPRKLSGSPAPRRLPIIRVLLIFVVGFAGWTYWNRTGGHPGTEVSISSSLPLSSSSRPLPHARRQGYRLKNGWVQHSYSLKDSAALLQASVHDSAGWAGRWGSIFQQSGEFPGVLDLAYDSAGVPRLLRWRGQEKSLMLLAREIDDGSFAWLEWSTSCRWPGPCPSNPLEGAALSAADEEFDFRGREELLNRDEFQGLGESPVLAILPGHLVELGPEAGGTWGVRIYHGYNLKAHYSGLSSLAHGLEKGQILAQGQVLGRLAPRDSAAFRLALHRNGRFLRWDDFWRETRPLDAEPFATFLSTLGL